MSGWLSSQNTGKYVGFFVEAKNYQTVNQITVKRKLIRNC